MGKEGDVLLVCMYVDDLIYMGPSLSMMEQFKSDMQRTFDMTDLGLLSYFLGLEVKQDELGIHVSQKKYIEDLLKSFNLNQCKTSPIPLSPSLKLQTVDDTELVDATSFRKLIGKLIYVTQSRPDIAFPVSFLSRFMQRPTRVQFGAAKHILRYLAGSMEFGIFYQRNKSCTLEGYSDSDWGGNMKDRKSTTGVAFHIGSGVVSWISKKQDIVALSSTEAEYISLCAACCQGVWLKKLLEECELKVNGPIKIWCDNKSCIAIAKNPVLHGRTKHIDVKFHFIRNLVEEKVVKLDFCTSEEQLADVFTKCLNVQKFQKFRSCLGVCDLQLRGSMLNSD